MNTYLSSALFADNQNIKHGFFTRAHGISRDEDALKQQNLNKIAEILSIDPNSLLTLKQVHSAHVVVVDGPFLGKPPEADALITTKPGLFLGVLTSDCVPILLSSSTMVAAIHAGWKGALAGIVQNTLSKMTALGAQNIKAALGPCIWQQSYEVSDDFYEKFKSPQFFIGSARPGHWYFDLPGFVVQCLRASGVKQIDCSKADTYSNPDQFYSFRRKTHNPQETFKNNISVIGLCSS